MIGTPAALGWRDWLRAAQRLDKRFAGHHAVASFRYEQPLALQRGVPLRLRRTYDAPVVYTDWGPRSGPVLVCCGGVANTAARFSFVAADLAREGIRVVCMDWLGRGRSGWLADGKEYTLETYVEQLRQMIQHLDAGPVAVLGSSMGGTAAISLAASDPQLVSRLLLNDVGPHIPQARRTRRAQALARHYVFRSPDDITRRIGAAQKNDGPVSDEVRMFIAYHQTRWSDEDSGRVYRHDPRAMMAYRKDSARSVDQWEAWDRIRCPALVVHGLESDALTAETLARMQSHPAITVVHIPDTGHTPVLSDRHQTAMIGEWLRHAEPASNEFSLLHAPSRKQWTGSS